MNMQALEQYKKIALDYLNILNYSYDSNVFSFSLQVPVNNYHPCVVSEMMKTDNTNSLMVYHVLVHNKPMQKFISIPLIYGIPVYLIKDLIDMSFVEGLDNE
jgi:hypothetical protein